MILNRLVWLVICGTLLLGACSKPRSGITNWKYNTSKWGGFEVKDYPGQSTGPNLVLVQGGTFVMGNTEQDVLYENNTIPRRVTVSSFYMDETEVANVHYREYLYWLKRTFVDFPDVYKRALPDTLVWREELAYNEPYVEYYLRHPAYNYYPVVGVSWLQASDFCQWRTDRVNEMYLIEKKVLSPNSGQQNEDNFNTEAYLLGQYEGAVRKNGRLKDLDPSGSGERNVRMEDGILLPDYRLPTEAEWEYAALGLIGNHVDPEKQEMITDRRIYPWNGTSLRLSKHGGWQGDFLANFKRGRGDYGGLAGNLNDNSMITAPIYSFMPNDYGLYNMVGNVSEWVFDVYRPLTYMDMQDLNPVRGNEFEQKVLDEEGNPIEKDTLGRIQYEVQKDEDVANRRNYKRGNVINYLDGDSISLIEYSYAISTLVSDKTRVFKGGSWADEAFWLAPGSRRYLEEDQSTSTLGFRCAMIRLGGDVNNKTKGGNNFKETDKVRDINKKQRKFK